MATHPMKNMICLCLLLARKIQDVNTKSTVMGSGRKLIVTQLAITAWKKLQTLSLHAHKRALPRKNNGSQ